MPQQNASSSSSGAQTSRIVQQNGERVISMTSRMAAS